MNKVSRFMASVAFMTCGMANAYDATADFSTNANPNGVWQYGYSIGGGAYSFTLFDTPFNEDGIVGWRSSTYQGGGAPVAWKNMTGSTLYGAAPGQLSLHPGPDPFSPAILRFTAPTSGDYSYFVQFFEGDTGVMNGSVFVNENLADPLATFGSTNGNPSTGGSIFMSSGDRFDVAVGNHGSYFGGTTPIYVTIVAEVPEPRFALMFGAGLVALLLMRRRPPIG